MTYPMVIAAIVLLIMEAAIDVAKGDLHDLWSDLRILRDALIVSAVGLWSGFAWGFVIYVVLRFCLFDYLYSWFRFGHIWYLGRTAETDKAMKLINPYLLLATRILTILALIFVL